MNLVNGSYKSQLILVVHTGCKVSAHQGHKAFGFGKMYRLPVKYRGFPQLYIKIRVEWGRNWGRITGISKLNTLKWKIKQKLYNVPDWVVLEYLHCETNDLCVLWNFILRKIFRDLWCLQLTTVHCKYFSLAEKWCQNNSNFKVSSSTLFSEL